MVATAAPAHQGRPPFCAAPPWDRAHPDWLRLDAEIPPDDPARLLAQLVDQLDLTRLYQRYAHHGSAPLPPDLLLKVALYEFSQNHPSPKTWADHCRRYDPVKWLAFGLRPSVAACYRFRAKVGPRLLDDFNRQVLRLAGTAGHVVAVRGAADGSLIAAYGSRHSLMGAKGLQARLQVLRQAIAADGAVARLPAWLVGGAFLNVLVLCGTKPATRRPRWLAKTPRGRARQYQRYQAAQRHLQRLLAEHEKKQKRQRKAKRRPAEWVKVCPREHTAVLGRDKLKVFRPVYNVQLVYDLDSQFVLGYGTYNAVCDAGLLPKVLGRTRSLLGRLPKQMAVDGIYASGLDLEYCQQRGVEVYAPERAPASAPGRVPLPVVAEAVPPVAGGGPGESGTGGAAKGKAKKGPKYMGKGSFAWVASEQVYRCPAGQVMPLHRVGTEKRREGQEVAVKQYRCPAEHCQKCALASACTKSPHKGRTIKRMAQEELVEALRGRMATEAGQELYRLRKQSVELGFADTKCRRGLERVGGFGSAVATGQTGWSVLAHNGLALMRAARSKPANALPAFLPTG
jgi:transposase